MLDDKHSKKIQTVYKDIWITAVPVSLHWVLVPPQAPSAKLFLPRLNLVRLASQNVLKFVLLFAKFGA